MPLKAWKLILEDFHFEVSTYSMHRVIITFCQGNLFNLAKTKMTQRCDYKSMNYMTLIKTINQLIFASSSQIKCRFILKSFMENIHSLSLSPLFSHPTSYPSLPTLSTHSQSPYWFNLVPLTPYTHYSLTPFSRLTVTPNSPHNLFRHCCHTLSPFHLILSSLSSNLSPISPNSLT